MTMIISQLFALSPVDVIFSVRRNIKVDNHIHVGNIQPSRGYICGHQNVSLAGFELVQRAKPLCLRELAVQTNGIESKIAEKQCDTESIVASGGEYNNALSLALVQHVSEITILPF